MPAIPVRIWEEYDVRIDRQSKWGNRFIIGRDGTREEVIEKFRVDLWARVRSGEITLQELAGLHNKRLGCHCAPKPCHGDILSKAAAWAVEQLKKTIAD